MQRVVAATGAAVQSTVSDLEAGGKASCLGTCGLFEEKQVGAERYNVFTRCPAAKSATMVLRGGSDAFVDEAERSLHDAVMIVRRAIKNAAVVAGGGAIDMELSRYEFIDFYFFNLSRFFFDFFFNLNFSAFFPKRSLFYFNNLF